MSKPPVHIVVDAEWHDDPPTEPGLYWFYGELFMGEMGGHYTGSVVPQFKLELVRIQQVSNGCVGTSNGHFVKMRKWDKDARKSGVLGKWAQVIVPSVDVGSSSVTG